MKLSVIIVSYNVRHYLQQCLDSLHRSLSGVDAEVFVVDNHSKDDTVSFLKSLKGNIHFIASNNNNGFAKANNMAIRQTSGEYVLLLNPDTIVGEDTIKDCLAFMDAHKNAGGVGVRMLKCDGSDAMESRRGLPSPMTAFYKMCGLCAKFPKSHRFGKYYMGYLPWDEPAKIEVISGAFCMMRREALSKAGLLDEEFFMYGEDIDLSYRLLKCGYDNWYVPAKILHYKGESTQKSSFRYVHVFYEAMLIFLKKHYGHQSFWLTIPIKTAIYLKATFALIRMSSEQAHKMLGFTSYKRRKTPEYVFIGTADSLDKCRKKAEQHGLVARYMAADEKQKPHGHADETSVVAEQSVPVYVVYDTNAYSYKTILEIFSNNPLPNVFIGTYNPESDIIITDKEVID